MNTNLVRLAVCVVAAACVSPAQARLRYDALPDAGALLQGRLAPAFQDAQQAGYDDMLIANGVDPGTQKGKRIAFWIARVNGDPVVVGNLQRASKLYLDASARSALMTEGFERLSAVQRLRYIALVSTLLDTLVPPDCFGLSNMSEVMDRVPLNAMSEAQIDDYFGLLLEILRATGSEAEPLALSEQQYASADASLRLSLLNELQFSAPNVARYTAYTKNPASAAPVDACWAMRTTLHAILAMPDPDRDVVLRLTVRSQHAAFTSGP